MQEYSADGSTDQAELLVGVRCAIVCIELCRNTVSTDGIFEDLLEVCSGVAVKEFTTYNQAGMIIDDADGIDPSGTPVLCDVREITSVRLPHFSKGIFLKGFPVFHVRIAGTL